MDGDIGRTTDSTINDEEILSDLSSYSNENKVLGVSLSEAIRQISDKRKLRIGDVKKATDRLRELGILQNIGGTRTSAEWQIKLADEIPVAAPEQTETKEAVEPTDEDLVVMLNEKIGQLDQASEQAQAKLSEAENVIENARAEMARIEVERPKLVEARDRLAQVVDARKLALELLGSD